MTKHNELILLYWQDCEIASGLKEIRIAMRWKWQKIARLKKTQNKYEIGRARINNGWRLSSWILELNEFKSVIEAGSNGLNFFFSGKMGLLFSDCLYSGAQRFDSYTVGKVPILDIVIVDSDFVELFWLVSEALGDDLVFTDLILAFTSFEYVASLYRVENYDNEWCMSKNFNP